jgi:hypothetical protein
MIKKAGFCLVFAPLFFAASPTTAAVLIQSGAYGLSSTVKVINTVGVTVGPVAAVNGATSPGYNIDGTVASVAADVDLGVVSLVAAGLSIDTGLITTNATANGTTPLDTSSGSGFARVDNLGVNLFTRLFGITTNAIGLTADTITSQTSVVRVGNINTLTGQSVLSNLNLSVLSLLDLNLGVNAQVAANTVALDALGLKITLNEQSSFNDGNGFQSLITNALRLNFNNYLLGGRALTGDIIIGHSEASILVDPLPEPGVWLQLIAGFGATGMVVRTRRSQARPATA